MQTDPTLDPSVLDKLYHSGAWICLGILALFFALRFASTNWKWLQEDHRAVWVSAILGGLALLVVPATQGTTPNLSMVLGAIITVASLHANPKKPSPIEQKLAQGGFVRPMLMMAIAAITGAVLLVGCSSNARLKTLDATLAALDSAKIGLTSMEPQLEADIVDKATSLEDGQAKLKTWRAKRDEAVKALVAAYTILQHAFQLDDDASMANAIAAATAVEAQLKGLGL